MAEQTISNAQGAFQKIADFTTGRTDDGELLSNGSTRVGEYRANATIAKGEVVMWVAPTTTVPLSVTPMTAAAVSHIFAGVANHAAVAGDTVQITEYGPCVVDVAAETAAFDTVLLVPATTTGKAEIGAADPDATAVVGTVIGVTLAAKDSDNLAYAFIKHY